MPDEPDDLDGCDEDFTVEDQLTDDGEQVDALTMFADVPFDDPVAVEHRRRQLVALDAHHSTGPDDVPTTGAPDA
jgi:hypothetical protein